MFDGLDWGWRLLWCQEGARLCCVAPKEASPVCRLCVEDGFQSTLACVLYAACHLLLQPCPDGKLPGSGFFMAVTEAACRNSPQSIWRKETPCPIPVTHRLVRKGM